MKIIRNNGKVPDIKTKYMLKCYVKSEHAYAYAKVNIVQAFWGLLYELGIVEWGHTMRKKGA